MKKKGYLFISNGTKPSTDSYESCEAFAPGSFSQASIWAANQLGWQLHMGINRKYPENIKSLDFEIHFYDQHCYRNIFAIKDNWIAYRNLCKYLKKNPNIEIIHCNTPIGGVVGRVAGKKFGKKVIYTAHGFHFFKGAPLLNRTVLKWIEQWLAHYTDILITINQEDFEAAQKFKLKKGGRVFKVPGVGMDTHNFINPINRNLIRQNLGISNSDFVCICMGDIVKRKNYKTSIESIAHVNNKRIQFLICGIGPEGNYLKELVRELNIEDQIHFLGFRRDIKDLLFASDCFLFSSLQEGLPRSTMEAMAAGLPCIVSDIRGNRDLIENGRGGFLVSSEDSQAYADAILKLMNNPQLCKEMGEWNLNRIKDFDIGTVKDRMYNIFKDL